jgi:hypothetical protein
MARRSGARITTDSHSTGHVEPAHEAILEDVQAGRLRGLVTTQGRNPPNSLRSRPISGSYDAGPSADIA